MMDQTELLALVAEGKDAWNEWADANPDATVDFSDVTFDNDMSFSGFQFPKYTDFKGATFSSTADFRGATFSGRTDFKGATFSSTADFSTTKITGPADFRWTKFTDAAYFRYTTFTRYANFIDTEFLDIAIFNDTTFSDAAYFSGATFSDAADFSDTTILDAAEFDGTTFSDAADFRGAMFSGPTDFSKATFSDTASFSMTTFTDYADFSEATFMAVASFISIDVQIRIDFEDAEFRSIPDFSAAKNPERIALETVEFELPGPPRGLYGFFYRRTGLYGSDRSTMISIRHIRGIANKNHAVDTERDLTILERNAQVGASWTTLWCRFIDTGKTAWTTLVKPSRIIDKTDAIDTEAALTPLDRNAQIGAIPELWNESKPLRQWFVNLSTTFLETLMLLAYRWSSRYGRSVIRPVIWLVGSFYSYRWLYGYLYDKVSPDYQEAKNVSDSLLDFTITSMVPFGSNVRPTYQIAVNDLFLPIEQTLLEGRVPAMFQFASLSQGVLTLTFVFLIGLALRNFFRMK